MTNEQLCALALAAIDDTDARVVLADAIEESGWWDERLHELPYPKVHPTHPTYAERIAAVLLTSSWPTSWPLAERCLVITSRDRIRAEFDRIRQQQVDWQVQRARDEWARIHGWP